MYDPAASGRTGRQHERVLCEGRDWMIGGTSRPGCRHRGTPSLLFHWWCAGIGRRSKVSTPFFKSRFNYSVHPTRFTCKVGHFCASPCYPHTEPVSCHDDAYWNGRAAPGRDGGPTWIRGCAGGLLCAGVYGTTGLSSFRKNSTSSDPFQQ